MTDIDLAALEREQPEDPDLDEQTVEAVPVDEDTFDLEDVSDDYGTGEEA